MTSRMKKRVWSDPDKQWEGFQLTRYWLDINKIVALPLTQVRQIDGKTQETSTTLGEVYARLRDRKLDIKEGVLEIELTAENESETLKGPSFSHRMLNEMLKLRAEGYEPTSVQWYFYDHNSCREDPHESYSFFLVSHDKVVKDDVSFSDYHGSGFDPDVFQSDDDSDVWVNDSAWREAQIRFWYKKFYSETRTGQLMLLRDDEPEIFGSDKSIGNPEHLVLANLFALVRRVHVALWVLIALTGFILFRLWK